MTLKEIGEQHAGRKFRRPSSPESYKFAHSEEHKSECLMCEHDKPKFISLSAAVADDWEFCE